MCPRDFNVWKCLHEDPERLMLLNKVLRFPREEDVPLGAMHSLQFNLSKGFLIPHSAGLLNLGL